MTSDGITLRTWDARTGAPLAGPVDIPRSQLAETSTFDDANGSDWPYMEVSRDGRTILYCRLPMNGTTATARWDIQLTTCTFDPNVQIALGMRQRSYSQYSGWRMSYGEGWVIYGLKKLFWLPPCLRPDSVSMVRDGNILFIGAKELSMIDITDYL